MAGEANSHCGLSDLNECRKSKSVCVKCDFFWNAIDQQGNLLVVGRVSIHEAPDKLRSVLKRTILEPLFGIVDQAYLRRPMAFYHCRVLLAIRQYVVSKCADNSALRINKAD